MTPRTDPESSADSATAILSSAADFGLSRQEILQTVAATLDRLPGDMRSWCIDDLAGSLASQLLEKQRSTEVF